MQLFAFGINHQTAPLEVRERVAFNAEGLPEALRDLVDHEPVREAAIISTCNRTEVYCNTQEPAKAVDWLAGYHQLKTSALEPYVYTLPRERAVKHAFRVASGLDSMVLGEPQILGQIKQAVRSAEQAGTLGLVLHKLFQHTFSVAKEVRSRTEIGASSVSMAAAAVRLAERIFPSVAEQKMLFIGAGEMIELTATHFAAQHPRAMTFANRTLERAEDLAARLRREGGVVERSRRCHRRAGHHRDLHGQSAADHRQGHGGKRAEGPAPPPDADDRPGGAARRGGRSRPHGRRVPLHASTISARSCRKATTARCRR